MKILYSAGMPAFMSPGQGFDSGFGPAPPRLSRPTRPGQPHRDAHLGGASFSSGKNKSRQKPTIQTKADKSRQKTDKIMLRLGGINKSRQKQTKIFIIQKMVQILGQHLSAFVGFCRLLFLLPNLNKSRQTITKDGSG